MSWELFPRLAGGNRPLPIPCSECCFLESFGVVLSLVLGSSPLCMHRSVLCRMRGTLPWCSLCAALSASAFYLMNASCRGLLPRLSVLSLQLRASSGLCFSFHSLGHGLEILPRQEAWTIVGLTSFVSCLSDITLIHCLTSWKLLIHVLFRCWFLAWGIILWVYENLTPGKAGWRMHKHFMWYFCTFLWV